MTEPPSGVRSRTLLEFLAYPLRVGVSQLLEDCDRSLVRRDRPAVIPLVAVDVSEAVPGCSLAGLVALLLLHRQGLLAGRECFVVPAEHGQRPAHRVERVRLSDRKVRGAEQPGRGFGLVKLLIVATLQAVQPSQAAV